MEKEGNPLYQNPIFELTQFMDNYIEEKYITPRDRREARRDAMMYAVSQMAWFKIEPFFHPVDYEDEELVLRNQMIGLWDRGIEEAIKGDWSGIKRALQDYFRSSSRVSTISEFIPNATQYSESAERTATSFINLANSI